MVLGLRSKSRKSVSFQVDYLIHVQEVKPWPQSQTLKSAQSVVVQWENGDRNSGSFTCGVGDGTIGIGTSFRLLIYVFLFSYFSFSYFFSYLGLQKNKI